MSFIDKNANFGLIVLISILAIGIVATTVFFHSKFSDINGKLSTKLDELQKTQENFENTRSQLKETKEDLEIQYIKIQKENEDLKEEKDNLEERNERLQKDLEETQSNVRTLERDLRNREE